MLYIIAMVDNSTTIKTQVITEGAKESFGIHTVIKFLSSTTGFFFLLLWLMVLLVIGTLAQKEIGLYFAQDIFFSSWFIWVFNAIPLPGGRLTLALIFIGLLIKLLKQKWTAAKLGTIVLHVGALLLLLGGFVTVLFSYEGSMVIAEGESSHYIADYHEIELVISEQASTVLPVKEWR